MWKTSHSKQHLYCPKTTLMLWQWWRTFTTAAARTWHRQTRVTKTKSKGHGGFKEIDLETRQILGGMFFFFFFLQIVGIVIITRVYAISDYWIQEGSEAAALHQFLLSSHILFTLPWAHQGVRRKGVLLRKSLFHEPYSAELWLLC